ncbi:hypothetical protein OG229_02710 [Streptomyces platensis]|nr:hypothetical protein OG229_02710 [Streptomyces platensis]
MNRLRALAARLRRREPIDPQIAALEQIYRRPAATHRNTGRSPR